MSNKVLIPVLMVITALCVGVVSCTAGFAVAKVTELPGAAVNLPNESYTTETPSDTETLFAPFWQAWAIIHQNYVDQPVDDIALMRGAIRGMLAALNDQHTTYMDPQEFIDANTSLAGEYEGIGAWVNTEGEFLRISEPMPGSPAEEAGLKPGDEIIAIDGEDMTGILPELARQKVLGPKGSSVVLTIRRPDVEQPFDVTVTRATIIVPSVTGKMLEGNIAYVRLYTFGGKTSSELETILKDLMAQNPNGLILDLRNNGGGYLDTAVEVGSQFIADGVILYEQYGDGQKITFDALGDSLATELPMVVLVNEWSASASEVVAGALQDNERAQLVGEQTYGKGSVQNWIALDDKQGAVRVTIARWLTPDGNNIHQVGLTPDVVVERDEQNTPPEDDAQLDQALELLTQK